MSASISKPKSKPKLVALTSPDSPRTEMFRALKTNIEFADDRRERRIMAVTSAKPGEGKTVTIANLAVLYAQSGRRVLLVDANLRKPDLHEVFMADNKTGLADLLTGAAVFDYAVQELPVPNLSLLPAGRIAGPPSDLLGSERMLDLLESLRARYDLVLLDTSAMLGVTDSQVLSAFCDGVVFVVRAGKVKQRDAMRAMEQMERVRAKVVGVVLNRA